MNLRRSSRVARDASAHQIHPRSALTRGALTGAYPYGKARRRTPGTAGGPAPTQPCEVQEAIARDLMQAAEAHEELIRQYLCVMGDATHTAAM